MDNSITGMFHKLRQNRTPELLLEGPPFTREGARVNSVLMSLDIEGHYSKHSLRRGTATSARKADLNDERIQQSGRWKLNSYHLYIVTHPARILITSRRPTPASSVQSALVLAILARTSTASSSPSTRTPFESIQGFSGAGLRDTTSQAWR